jgi:hypothetical protein
MTDRLEALLQARLDDELTPDQRAELERLLAGDESARRRAGELAMLADALNLLGPLDPPASVMRAVFSQISHAGPAGTASAGDAPAAMLESEMATTGGLVMRSKVLWGLAAVAAIVLAVFAVKGFPPSLGGTEGAIGAAKRYQAGQIAASDVKLGDEAAQQFLQSDVFDKILRDDATRKLFGDANFRALAGDKQFRDLLAGQELKGLLDTSALADAKVGAALADNELTAALSSDALSVAFANKNFLRALNDTEFRNSLASELRGLIDNAALRARVQDDTAFKGQLQKMDRVNMLKSDAFLRALSSVEFRRVAFSDQFLRAFGDAELSSALANNEFRALLGDANLRLRLRAQGLSQALSDQSFRQLARSGALNQALASGALQQALAAPGLSAALRIPQFAEAMRMRSREQ